MNGIVSLKETLTADSVIYVNTSSVDSTTETDDDKVVSLIFTDPGTVSCNMNASFVPLSSKPSALCWLYLFC